MSVQELKATIEKLVVPGKGILAADESTSTITKRFAAISLESTEENRRAYRELLFTTSGIHAFINGVILFEETLNQSSKAGKPFPVLLEEQGIVPGIKVDKGLVSLAHSQDENITRGLDDLSERLADYKKKGARFAKWRAVLTITDQLPSVLAMTSNAEMLARYAAICQEQGIVPIVEPEVLMDGDHTLERCAAVTEETLHEVFNALARHRVLLEGMILKPNMAISGKSCAVQADVAEVAAATVRVLLRKVPAAVPSINFLSGGQSAEKATAHLNAMNTTKTPWALSFSYGRALQDACLKTWKGQPENVAAAQEVFYRCAQANSAASLGQLA